MPHFQQGVPHSQPRPTPCHTKAPSQSPCWSWWSPSPWWWSCSPPRRSPDILSHVVKPRKLYSSLWKSGYSCKAKTMMVWRIMMAYLRTSPTRGLRTFTYLGVSYSIRVFSKSFTPILVVSFIVYSKNPWLSKWEFSSLFTVYRITNYIDTYLIIQPISLISHLFTQTF